MLHLALALSFAPLQLSQNPVVGPLEWPHQEPDQEPVLAPAVDRYAELLARYEAQLEAHKQAIREERDPAKRRALRGETAEKALLPDFEALVAAGDGRGLLWIARHVGAAGLSAEEARARRAAAWRAIAHEHLAAPWIGEGLDLIKRLRSDIGRSTALELLEHAHLAAANPEVKAQAAHALVQCFESSTEPAEQERKAALEALLAGEYAATAYAQALRQATEPEPAPTVVVTSEPVTPPAPPPPPAPGVVIGHFAPPLAGEDALGAARSLAEAQGRVTVVAFFGYWSPPARKALLDLQELEQKLGDPRFMVFGVSTGDTRAAAQEWQKKLSIAWPVVVQGVSAAPISERWQVTDSPELYVLDAAGRVAGRVASGVAGDLEALVRRELGKLGPPR